jgi:zinc transporter ZupT
MLLDVINALFYFYALLFTGALIAMFIGLRMLYVALLRKDDDLLRKAKFVLLFAIIAMTCLAVVSFYVTGRLPLD